MQKNGSEIPPHQSARSYLIGIGFRLPIAQWTYEHLDRFDVLEITVDHYIRGGQRARRAIRGLKNRLPIVLHGVGLSLGTDAPLDEVYVEDVRRAIDDLDPLSYSEHLAWTKVPGIDLANLLPVPKTRAAADMLSPKIERLQAMLPVPIALENISYVFEFPEAEMGDADFFNLLHRETGVELLLDVENLYVNERNHGADARGFLDALPEGVVRGVHAAGGPEVDRPYLAGPTLADNHSHAVPEEALDLLEYALLRQSPETVILERDSRLEHSGEILADLKRIRARVARAGGAVEAAADA